MSADVELFNRPDLDQIQSLALMGHFLRIDLDTNTAWTECIQHATEAIENFLDLHGLSLSVCRSWAFVHNAVSCAIALKSLSAQAEGLMVRLVEVLEKEEKSSEWCDADTNVRCFGPYSRALKALREICK